MIKVTCELDVSENAHGEVLIISGDISRQCGFITLTFGNETCGVKPEELLAAIERVRSDM